MGLDKSFARSGSPRVPEMVLYTLAALGGSAGIIIGSHFFRHKSRKAVFQLTLLLIVCVHLYALRALGLSFAR